MSDIRVTNQGFARERGREQARVQGIEADKKNWTMPVPPSTPLYTGPAADDVIVLSYGLAHLFCTLDRSRGMVSIRCRDRYEYTIGVIDLCSYLST